MKPLLLLCLLISCRVASSQEISTRVQPLEQLPENVAVEITIPSKIETTTTDSVPVTALAHQGGQYLLSGNIYVVVSQGMLKRTDDEAAAMTIPLGNGGFAVSWELGGIKADSATIAAYDSPQQEKKLGEAQIQIRYPSKIEVTPDSESFVADGKTNGIITMTALDQKGEALTNVPGLIWGTLNLQDSSSLVVGPVAEYQAGKSIFHIPPQKQKGSGLIQVLIQNQASSNVRFKYK